VISEQVERQRRKDCQHDVNALIQKERQYMPGLGNPRVGCRVWCDDCGVWIPFDFASDASGDEKHG
jgi:hypothetical protein